MTRKRKNKRQKWKDFTLDEQFTIIFIGIALFFILLHYVLAFMGLEPLETLATTWIVSIVAILVKYSIKSFKGKNEEEKMRYKRDLNNVPDAKKIFEENEMEEDELWNG